MTAPNLALGADANGGDREAGANSNARPSDWCTSLGKRTFDVVLAMLLLAAAFPLMVLASFAVLTSRGPLFFASSRVGQAGRRIRVWKFRTMYHRPDLGVQLTRRGDNRVTPAGRFLRKWKIDELPQLMNVVRGDMSLVGPRPDSAEFLDTLPPYRRSFLASLKPGITSVATLRFRNEEELLSRVPEAQLTSYYVTTLLPLKVQLDLQYACHATVFTDLLLMLRTVAAIVG